MSAGRHTHTVNITFLRLFTFSQGSNDMCIQDNFLADIIGFQLLNQLSCRHEKLPWKAIYTANSSVS